MVRKPFSDLRSDYIRFWAINREARQPLGRPETARFSHLTQRNGLNLKAGTSRINQDLPVLCGAERGAAINIAGAKDDSRVTKHYVVAYSSQERPRP
jgi:hypothetical protein